MEGKFKSYKNIQNNFQVTKSYDIMPLKGEKFFKNHRENKRKSAYSQAKESQ